MPFSMPHDVAEVVHRLCENVASPRSLTVSLLLKNEEWDQLVSLECVPSNYNSAESYRSDAIVTDLLRKCEDLPTTFDREGVALENFWKSERSCYRANERLHPYLTDGLPAESLMGDYRKDEGISLFLSAIQKNVSQILGPCPDVLMGRFGPGATFGDRGQFSTVPDKMSSCPTLTSDSFPFLLQWSGTAWATACAESGRNPVFVRGNRFTTVPKDAKKDRGIAIEPSLNVFYQLAYGSVIKNRLRSAGLNLRDGQDIHRQLAREASIRGDLATLDLSNASDTVCSNLVKLLLPPKWFECLSALRSPFTLVKEKWVRLEKFSSMGNGYTFELETLIFFAIAKTAMELEGFCPLTPSGLSVYGDDIIVPTEFAGVVKSALRFLGFSLNETKSFVSGPFRESCGGDYFEGMDVRPFFLKKLPYEPQHYIAFANGIRRLGLDDPSTNPIDHPYRRAWLRILDAIPSDIRRCRGPQALGDLAIHDMTQNWAVKWKDSIRWLRVYQPATHRTVGWQYFRPSVVLASAVYGLSSGERYSGVTPRNAILSYKTSWCAFS